MPPMKSPTTNQNKHEKKTKKYTHTHEKKKKNKYTEETPQGKDGIGCPSGTYGHVQSTIFLLWGWVKAPLSAFNQTLLVWEDKDTHHWKGGAELVWMLVICFSAMATMDRNTVIVASPSTVTHSIDPPGTENLNRGRGSCGTRCVVDIQGSIWQTSTTEKKETSVKHSKLMSTSCRRKTGKMP